jgi:hypothetical protein
VEAEKRCTKCGQIKPFSAFSKHKLGIHGLRPRCRACTAIENADYRARTVEHRASYNRSWKKSHPESHQEHNQRWIDAHPVETKAHRAVRNAIQRGELVRPDACSDCGARGRIHAHHYDYLKPLEVTWLCPRCHAEAKEVMTTHA